MHSVKGSFLILFPSVGLGADPGVQAVGPQMTKPSTQSSIIQDGGDGHVENLSNGLTNFDRIWYGDASLPCG